MTRSELVPFAGIAACLGVAGLVVLAGSQNGESVNSLSVLAWCAFVAFAVQWLAFIPAYAWRTEKFFDLTGSLTYISLVIFAVIATDAQEWRSLILASLVIAWAVRLGSFLFVRVLQSGGDRRFAAMKRHPASFLMTWTVQGLWVFLTASAALAAITAAEPARIDWSALAGIGIWIAGFLIEIFADAQKQRFRKDPANQGRFIRSGLWAWSRHPNYFGEILVWVGIAVIAAPSLAGWQWLTMASPLFVVFLLTRVSGIPLLERRGKERWGDDPLYQAYVANTPVLIPRPPSRATAP